MRELIARLLPKSGVLGVPSVPVAENLENTRHGAMPGTGTPFHAAGVLHVPRTAPDGLEHLAQKDVFQEKFNEINIGTPGTPRTPIFDQDFINALEERAAIMEYDASDCYPTCDMATGAAYKACVSRLT